MDAESNSMDPIDAGHDAVAALLAGHWDAGGTC